MSRRMKIAGAIVGVFVLIQFVPINRTNPAVTGEIEAPAQVKAIFKRACYDCHSNETRWPAYSYVAPVSWLVADDVSEGRRHLNFSEWNQMNERRQRRKAQEVREQVEKGDMPLWYYLPMHPSAKLRAEDKEVLQNWADAEGE